MQKHLFRFYYTQKVETDVVRRSRICCGREKRVEIRQNVSSFRKSVHIRADFYRPLLLPNRCVEGKLIKCAHFHARDPFLTHIDIEVSKGCQSDSRIREFGDLLFHLPIYLTAESVSESANSPSSSALLFHTRAHGSLSRAQCPISPSGSSKSPGVFVAAAGLSLFAKAHILLLHCCVCVPLRRKRANT